MAADTAMTIFARRSMPLFEGVRLFDTAEIYGMGKSERLLGELSRDEPGIVIATKFFPFPWRLRSGDDFPSPGRQSPSPR